VNTIAFRIGRKKLNILQCL